MSTQTVVIQRDVLEENFSKIFILAERKPNGKYDDDEEKWMEHFVKMLWHECFTERIHCHTLFFL